MTYIKWKDEVESYLVNLPQEEKQKIFSYFSEMYADKRDAGKSEEQIIEEFGAPYDVARRILADSKEAAPQSGTASGGAASGGNNYNYNYYNYNYGGAPTGGKEIPEMNAPQGGKELPESDSLTAAPARPPKKRKSAFKIILCIILTVVLVTLTVSLIGGAITVIVEGFSLIGYTVGSLVSANCSGADGAAVIGAGLIIVGLGCILMAPFNALCGFLWRKLSSYMKGV